MQKWNSWTQHLLGKMWFHTLLFLLPGCHGNSSQIPPTTKQTINKAFQNWKENNIRNNTFFSMDSCNREYFVKRDSAGLERKDSIAVPVDSGEVSIYYAQLNNDSEPDALIRFIPIQCDGGNAMMWVQYQLLVLSHEKGYTVKDNYFDQFETSPEFFHLDSISTNTVYGTYYEFTEDDGRCCPGISLPLSIDILKNKIFYLSRYERFT